MLDILERQRRQTALVFMGNWALLQQRANEFKETTKDAMRNVEHTVKHTYELTQVR